MSSSSSSSSSSSLAMAAAAAAAASAALTAAAAYALHLSASRRQADILAKRRLEERRGRIRAEVKLRTLTKERQREAESHHDDDGKDERRRRDMMVLRRIGTAVSPFTKRMGTPRQGALAPNSRGYVQLGPDVPIETADGLDAYSHAWIVFAFHANTDVPGMSTKAKVRPPRAPRGTRVGMLATRSPHRPNPIGLSLVKVEGLDRVRRRVRISALDLVNGTPVYDIKPCVPWDIPGHHDGANLIVPDWVSQEDALPIVRFTPEASSSLAHIVESGESLSPLYTSDNDPGGTCAAKAICEVLAQDPRAANRRGTVATWKLSSSSPSSLSSSSSPPSSSDTSYKMVFGSTRVEFVVLGGGVVSVLGIEPISFDGALFVDGVPLSAEGGIVEDPTQEEEEEVVEG